jgi:hypothetical protein
MNVPQVVLDRMSVPEGVPSQRWRQSPGLSYHWRRLRFDEWLTYDDIYWHWVNMEWVNTFNAGRTAGNDVAYFRRETNIRHYRADGTFLGSELSVGRDHT